MIRLIVPATAARPGPPLSPVLGAAAVKVADFVTEFNNRTAAAGYAPGVPVRVRLIKLPANKFTLQLRGIPTHAVLRGCGRTPGGRLTRGALFDVLRSITPWTTPAAAATLLGSLRSTRWAPE